MFLTDKIARKAFVGGLFYPIIYFSHTVETYKSLHHKSLWFELFCKIFKNTINRYGFKNYRNDL